MAKLQGKVALVTGAGQGVGQGIAFALAAAGAKIAVTGRTLAKLEATVAEIEKRGGTALAIECDVKNAASLQACVARNVSALGGLNILVNNAHAVPPGTLAPLMDQASTAAWEAGTLDRLPL